LSAAVRDAIAGKLPASFNELGLRTLKNIEKPIRAYALSARVPSLSSEIPRAAEALPLPSKPSIAVLPFENLSGDRDQDYFADGIVEEIITALSRMRWMFVIARNSSFTYKGRAVDVKQIGREAGVRYILEGSVRKSGNKVRITGQLVDTSTGAHLWADRFEGGLENIFDLQDQVTTSVIGAISPRLEQAEITISAVWLEFISGPNRVAKRHFEFRPGYPTRSKFRCRLWHGRADLCSAKCGRMDCGS
jgi:TolB-like protein